MSLSSVIIALVLGASIGTGIAYFHAVVKPDTIMHHLKNTSPYIFFIVLIYLLGVIIAPTVVLHTFFISLFLSTIIAYPYIVNWYSSNTSHSDSIALSEQHSYIEDEQFNDAKLKDKITMIYIDSNGDESTRDIDIKKLYDYNGASYIDAYCHLRKKLRTFKVANIQRAWNT